MLRLLGPTFLALSLAVPTAALALGLGDIRVDSALHQPLVAQIELVGAVDDELGHLSAAIASDELFQRYNLERAAFIYGTTLTVGRNAQGRPVLNMRSTEKFTEPVVTLLVDLHTPGGELVREYTLFLDPAGLVATASAVGSAPAAGSAPVVGSASTVGSAAGDASTTAASSTDTSTATGSTTAASTSMGVVPPASTSSGHAADANKLLGQIYTVARRDTLAHIVTTAGARSRIERHRMMIAMYRANPAAFQSNFNRMHTGVTLQFPTAEQLAAISVDETNREYDAQMAAWRAPSRRSGASGTTGAVGSATAASAARAGAGAGAGASVATGATTGATALAGSGSPAAARTSSATGATTAAGALSPRAATAPTAPLAAAAAPAGSRPASGVAADAVHQDADHAALTQRIASLEQSLAQIQHELKQSPSVQSATPAATIAPAGPASATTPRSRAGAQSDAGSASGATESIAATRSSAVASRDAVPSHPAPSAAPAAAATVDEATAEDEEEEPAAPPHHGLQLIAMAGGAGLLFFLGAWIFLRRRNAFAYHTTPRYPIASTNTVVSASDDATAEDDEPMELSVPPPPVSQTEAAVSAPAAADEASSKVQPQATTKDTKSESSWFEDSFSTPIADLLNDPTVSLAPEMTAELPFDPTVKLPATLSKDAADTSILPGPPELEFAGDTVEQKFSFFNPESTTNTEHVVMGSGLNEPKPFVERRKNPADVLRQAIEREPDRSDLRLKLLELYYTAAEENRRAFLDATRQLAKNEKLASPEDWSRIADMGRTIAPGEELFAADLDADKRVA